MRTDEIRRSFREHFERRAHQVVPSSSLVPDARDATVLLTTAGMQQFKPYFLGLRTLPGNRATSTQKCFRTTDIDEVGRTARHLTFFEMMGNFSFGDYFKEGAVGLAWELVTGAWGMDPARLWATVYEGDDVVPPDEEAVALWLAVGLPPERIRRLGSDNFWAAGPTGPCGPCSELYYDRGHEHGCGRSAESGECGPGCECDRFLEFWNLVFMQYDRSPAGLTPLPMQCIDTGSGVERVAALLQERHSVYETDGFLSLIRAFESWSGTSYASGGLETRALRVLCDHGRAMSMLATDGVIPGNAGRGYILRRVIRRAVSHGTRIGLEAPFLERIHSLVVDQLGGAYPELEESRAAVAEILRAEEDRFVRTLETGMALLDDVIAGARAAGDTSIPGKMAFRLHDTHGFPFELTEEIAAEHDLSVDEADFARRMDEQRTRAREAARAGSGVERERAGTFSAAAGFVTEFAGFDHLDLETEIGAIEELDDARVLLKLRRSPFYAEGGGQVADHGTVESDRGRALVLDVLRHGGSDQVLVVSLEHGELARDERVRCIVDPARRRATMANHTGTHLLHRALRETLGDHVAQRGSAVRPDKLRFDFSHDRPLSVGELAAVEDRVNEVVLAGNRVHWFETTQDEARALGATMLFGEKYGDVVRVVEVDDYSRELCGGTHVSTTAQVGPFRVLGEMSVGQGVRRIEAVTATAATALLRRHDRALVEVARDLRADPEGVPGTVAALRSRILELEHALTDGGGARSGVDVEGLVAKAEDERGVAVLAALVDAPSGGLLELADALRGRLGPSVVVLGSADGGKAHLVATATPEAVGRGVAAGELIREASLLVGGGGGGGPAMARAGGKDPARLDDALAAARGMALAVLRR